jgi:hypothetical protein
MNLLNYSRDTIKQFVNDGICNVQALRDYDLLKQIESGDKITNVAMDHDLSRAGVYKIKNKYMPGKV